MLRVSSQSWDPSTSISQSGWSSTVWATTSRSPATQTRFSHT